MDTYLEALQEAECYIERAYYGINEMIEDIRIGKVSLCYSRLAMLSEGIEWLIDVFRLTEPIQIEKINKVDLSGFLETMLDAMQNEDVMLISDLLQFELLEVLRCWLKGLKTNLKSYSNEIEG